VWPKEQATIVPFGIAKNETSTSLNKEHHSFSVKEVTENSGRWGISGQVWSLSQEFRCHQSCQGGGKNAICTHSESCGLLGISPYVQSDWDRRWRSMIYDAGHRFCNKYITK
jgi:hypothetical protein